MNLGIILLFLHSWNYASSKISPTSRDTAGIKLLATHYSHTVVRERLCARWREFCEIDATAGIWEQFWFAAPAAKPKTPAHALLRENRRGARVRLCSRSAVPKLNSRARVLRRVREITRTQGATGRRAFINMH